MFRRNIAIYMMKFKDWRKRRKRIRMIIKGSRKRWKKDKADTTPPDTSVEEDAEIIKKYMRFGFSKEETLTIAKWQREHKCKYRTAGGRQLFGAFCDGYGFYFVPSSMGITKVITCACGAELNLSSYS